MSGSGASVEVVERIRARGDIVFAVFVVENEGIEYTLSRVGSRSELVVVAVSINAVEVRQLAEAVKVALPIELAFNPHILRHISSAVRNSETEVYHNFKTVFERQGKTAVVNRGHLDLVDKRLIFREERQERIEHVFVEV